MPKLTPEVRDQLAKDKARLERLARPTLPRTVGGRLTAGAEAADEATVDQVFNDLLKFKAPSESYRVANRHYYAALGKVYAVWLRIGQWPESARRELLSKIDDENRHVAGAKGRTSRGSDLHILLRFLIRHEGDERAEQRLRTRDVGALRQAARLGWTAAELAKGSRRGNGGLYRLYLDDIEARKAERTAGGDPKPTSSSNGPPPGTEPNGSPTPETNNRYRVRWGRALRKILAAKTVDGREIVIRARVDSYARHVAIIDAYQASGPTIDDAAWGMAMEGLEARLLARGPGGRKV